MDEVELIKAIRVECGVPTDIALIICEKKRRAYVLGYERGERQ